MIFTNLNIPQTPKTRQVSNDAGAMSPRTGLKRHRTGARGCECRPGTVRRPHAFGGALSLAYYAEPRATSDIDVNVLVSQHTSELAFEPLHQLGVDVIPDDIARVSRHGQTRVFWDGTPDRTPMNGQPGQFQRIRSRPFRHFR